MKRLIFIISMLLLLPLEVEAFSKINITCDRSDLKNGETTECKIIGDSDFEVAGLTVKLNAGPSIKINNLVTSSIWEGDGKDNFIALYTDENKKGKFEIATFEVEKISDEKAYIDLSEIIFVDENFEENSIKDNRIYIFEEDFSIKIIFIISIAIIIVGCMIFRNIKKVK